MPSQIVERLVRQPGAGIVLAIAFVAGACVPAEQINPPTAAFIAASDTLSTGVQPNLANLRKSLRHDMMVYSLKDHLAGEQASTSASLWLCSPNYVHQQPAIPLAAIDTRNKVLKTTTKASDDEFGPLIAALGKSYAIPGEQNAAKESYNAWMDQGDGKRCAELVQKGDPYAVRGRFRQESLGGVVAGIALAEAVWTVLKPVAVGALKNIDAERRAAAVKAYFADAKNVEIIKDQLEILEEFLSAEFELEQVRTAGLALATAKALNDPASPHWAEIRTLATTANCQKGKRVDLSSPERKACYDGMLKAASKPLTDALTAADAFDAALAKQIPDGPQRLSQQVTTLHLIALGKNPNDDQLKHLWSASLRYIALFQTANDARSDANQKKITDAWEAFQKALKGDK